MLLGLKSASSTATYPGGSLTYVVQNGDFVLSCDYGLPGLVSLFCHSQLLGYTLISIGT